MMTQTKAVKFLYIVILSICSLVLVSPFYIPIIFGATLSLAFFPILLKLENKGLSRRAAAALITTVFTFIISIPLFFFAIKGTMAVTEQLEKMSLNNTLRAQGVQELVSDLRHDFVMAIKKISDKYEFLDFLNEAKIDQYLGSFNTLLLKFFRDSASSLPLIFMLLLVMVLCLYSFLKHADGVRNFFKEITGFSEARMEELTHKYIKSSRQVYLSNIITGGVQSLMVAAGVSLLAQGEFFIVFFVTLILSFIPVVGAAPVAFLFAVLAFFKDNTTAAIILTVLSLITGVVDNLLRPWLASFGESKIPPVVAFIFVIGGAILQGFPGLFIGLLVGSYAYDTLPIFWEELKSKKGSDIS
ncbi:MAG: AI-2E family transporter [Bacteriovoracaceae bacterium]|nr:AI-2E family transporter [Bacteriovoracaceae bacterium]